MKKSLKIMMFLMMCVLLVACGGNNGKTEESKGKNGNEKKKLKVAVVFSGFLGDKSFNDSAYEGLKKAEKDFGIEFKVLESKVPSDWETNFISVASDSSYDLVLAISSQFTDIVNNHADEFKDMKIGIIDSVVKKTNVASAIFAQNEGSFLAGAAAAMFTKKTDVPNINGEKIIGWVGGMDIPVLQDFLTGYKQGAAYIDPETKVLVSFAGTFNDPLKGKELTLAQYSQGADIVMNVASNTGNGILEAAKETNKYAIGVDINQDDIYPGTILTSMLKRVDVATYNIIKQVYDGNFKGGEIVRMDASNGGVGLTDMKVMKDALKDKFPEDILQKIIELTEKIKKGEIKVESYPGFKVE